MSDPEIPSDEPTRADIRRIVASSSLGRQLRAAPVVRCPKSPRCS
jgi:hypothetical protein